MSTVTHEQIRLKWGEPMDDGNKYFPVHADQKLILQSKARFTAAIAGTGGGKTVIGPLWMMALIQKKLDKNLREPFLGMIVAPTYKVLSRATVPTLIDTFRDTEFEGEYKESQSLYVLPHNAGKIWCQGADNPGGLEGGQFDGIWGDEAGQFKVGVWTAIQSRTGAKRAPVLFTTTPYLKNWLVTDFFKRWKEGDPDYYVRQWASVKNPAYPQEEYDRAKRTMTPEKAAMRYDGLLTYSEGLVYPNMPNCYVTADPKDVLKRSGYLFGGVDFGWNDPFCALCGLLDSNDVLWVWYERYKSETPLEEHANGMPCFLDRTVKWYCEHDPEAVRRLQKGGHKCLKANKNIRAGIDAVNCRILSGKLRILTNRCPALVAEAEAYAYPEKDEIISGDKPVDADNHAMDALRYMIAGIDIKKAA